MIIDDPIAMLIADARTLAAVSIAAHDAYHRAKPDLVQWVNRAMAEDRRTEDLLGGNPDVVMTDSHRHHADFMDTVFHINRFELLAQIVPWAYRAAISHGFLPAYFPVALGRWKAAAIHLLDNAAASEITAVYDWMLERHDRFLLASAAPSRTVDAIPALWQETAGAFYAAMTGNRGSDAMALAHNCVCGPDALKDFCRHVIQPSLYRLGDQWEIGVLSVAEEHLGSAIAGQVMASFYPMVCNTPMTRGTAVVTALSNEFHEMGARMVADALTLSGWTTCYLGANTPSGSVLDMLEDVSADVLALSVVMPFNLAPAMDLIARMRSRKSLERVRVMVGGWVFTVIPDLWTSVSADGSAPNAPAAARLAARWWENRA